MIFSKKITLVYKVINLLKNIFLLSIVFFLCKLVNLQAMQQSAITAEKYRWQERSRAIDSEARSLKEEELIHTVEFALTQYKNIQLVHPQDHAVKLAADLPNQLQVTVVIDAFRAFTTAAYVLEQHPNSYRITTKSEVIARLASACKHPLLIGKSERGAALAYDIPNSPTRVAELSVTGRSVLHRTEAGAKGIFLAQNADIILVAGFVNAEATAEYIRKLVNPKITLAPMGHEATTPSLEDHVCALSIAALINNEKITIEKFIPALRKGSGSYFFSQDQWQYPHEDFKRCLEIGRPSFAIQAIIKKDYAILRRCQ